ncbi:MAG: sigma-E factor negative regulatory protein [Burkholderiaceae bacterium]
MTMKTTIDPDGPAGRVGHAGLQEQGGCWDERLSALADGRADAAELDALLARWGEQPALREQWQTTQLIGDVLRSSELAGQSVAGEALLQSLRDRLAQEPPPRRLGSSAAEAEDSTERGREQGLRAWLPPLAVAASFVALALALPLLVGGLPDQGGAALQPPLTAGAAGGARAERSGPALPALGMALGAGAEPSFVQAAGMAESASAPLRGPQAQ